MGTILKFYKLSRTFEKVRKKNAQYLRLAKNAKREKAKKFSTTIPLHTSLESYRENYSVVPEYKSMCTFSSHRVVCPIVNLIVRLTIYMKGENTHLFVLQDYWIITQVINFGWESFNLWFSLLSMDLKRNYVVTHKIDYFHIFNNHPYLLS